MYRSHPKIITPPDDVVIWRYMDLPKFLSLCISRSLHLCRMDHLRDPWEGYWPDAVVDDLSKPFELPGLEGVVVHSVPRPYDELRKSYFVSCWHESSWESASLWDQYGQSRGLAIRSTIGRLKRASVAEPNFYVGRIQYLDYSQGDIDGTSSNAFIPAFLKRVSFEHEREVRILIWDLPFNREGRVDWDVAKQYRELPVNLEDLIESVYISPECPLWHVDPVRQLLQKLGLRDVPIRRSKLYDRTIG